MNGCEYYQELISRHIDGELSADERAALARHLRGCDDCATVYKIFLDISDDLSAQLAEPPEALAFNVMAEIRRSEIKKKNRTPWKKLAAAAACVALILVAAGTMIPQMVKRSASVALSADMTDQALPEMQREPAPANFEAEEDAAVVQEAAPEAVVTPSPQPTVEPTAQPVVTAPPANTDTAAKPDYTGKYGTAAPAPTPHITASPATPVPAEPAAGADSGSGDMVFFSAAESGNTLLGSAPPLRAELEAKKSWTELISLLNGKDSKFDPDAQDAEEPDEEYIIVLMPDEKMEMKLYIFEDELYYTVLDKTAHSESTPPPAGSTPPPLKYKLAKCSVEDFLKYIEPFIVEE